MPPIGRRVVRLVLMAGLVTAVARGELPAEVPGTVERLGPPTAHWVWVGDVLYERVTLVDLDAGAFRGMIDVGYGMSQPLVATRRPEIYVPATYYSRHRRGDRLDLLEVYDATTLAPVAEIELPARRAIDNFALAHSTLTDDDRFVAVFNWTPATSLSIVDVERRVLTAEVPIPGCTLVYGAGDRSFFSLCADGALMVVTIDEEGKLASQKRTDPAFDPAVDPIIEKGVRIGERWYFVSFAGQVLEIDVADGVRPVAARWGFGDPSATGDEWRPGGVQPLAGHAGLGRLYVLVHHGGLDSHKEPGEEVWVFDTERRERIDRIELVTPGHTVMGERADVWTTWPWPMSSLMSWIVDRAVPAMVTQIAVTPGAAPLLVTASRFTGGLGVYDAASAEFLRRVQPVGWTLDVITAPYGGGR